MTVADIRGLKDFIVKMDFNSPFDMVMNIEPFFSKVIAVGKYTGLVSLGSTIDEEPEILDEWDHYGLAIECEDWLALKSSIEAIAKKSVRQLNFVSVREPIKKSGWMTNEIYREVMNNLMSSLKNSLNLNLGATLNAEAVEDLQAKTGEKAWNEINDALDICLLTPLWESYSHLLWHNLWMNHWSNIFFYICYSYINDEKMRQVFETHLKIMEKFIILGEKKGYSGSWLVLVM